MRINPGLPVLTLILLSAAVIMSCKKDHHGSPKSCKVIGYYDTVSNHGKYAAYYTAFSYNEDGRISSTLIGKKDSLSDGYIYNYYGNRIVVTPINTNGPATDTVVLDDKGRPATMIFQYIGQSYNTHSNYVYNDSGQLLYVVNYDRDGKVADTMRYHYTDGDVTSISYTSGYSVSYSYYTDKPASDAEFSRLESLIYTAGITPSSKHMLKAVQGGSYWENYNYTFDSNGRILTGEQVVTANGGIVTKRTFVYDCSEK